MLGFVHENCQLGHLGPELVGDLTPLGLRAVGVLLGEGGGDEGGDDAPALAFSIWDQREVPVIAINASEEEYRYRIFTLFHEYAHLLLRLGGISDENPSNSVERFCNQFAAYFLMPEAIFKQRATEIQPRGDDWSDHHVAQLATLFHVSKSAAAIHLEVVSQDVV